MVLCLKVPKKDAERARRLLLSNGWMATDQAIGHQDDCVLLPVKPEATGPVRALGLGPMAEIFLPPLSVRPHSLSEALEGRLSQKEMEQLVGSFDIVGDIAVMEIPPALQPHRGEIAQAVLAVHPQVKVVAQKTGGTAGPFRIRPVEVIAGPRRTLTIARESGCWIAIDLNAAYYTSRWSSERLRIARQIKKGEKIIVAFAGVGPYPLVFEKHADAAAIVAIELNPAAALLMRRNVELNHCRKIEAIEGDVGLVLSASKFRAWADRILMPHPTEAARFLPLVLPALRHGGILHYYCFAPAAGAVEAAFANITPVASRLGYSLTLVQGRIVRPYSPTMVQVVLDLKVNLQGKKKTMPPARARKKAPVPRKIKKRKPSSRPRTVRLRQTKPASSSRARAKRS